MKRDRPLGVGCRRIDEVDDDTRLLAGMGPHDPADPLLVDPAARRRRQVHAHRRPRRVPALGEELGVDQDVDLATLVGGERLGERSGGVRPLTASAFRPAARNSRARLYAWSTPAA